MSEPKRDIWGKPELGRRPEMNKRDFFLNPISIPLAGINEFET